MKTKFLFFAFFLATGVVLAGCNQKKQYRPDAKIVSALNTKYPKAERIEWKQKHNYQVAEFHTNGMESEAWFDNNGKWLMTETDVKYNNLPVAIRNSFDKSMYSGWKKDDIDKIERAGMAPVYIIEVEKEGNDTDLYYTENGMLVKVLDDAKRYHRDGYMPISPIIKDKIALKYPDATIVETDDERGRLHVDVIDNGKSKEIVFHNNDWASTSWKINKAEVPSAVNNALRESEYTNYRVDDIYFYETPDSSYYLFELEQGNKDVHLAIDPTGKVIRK